MLRLFHRCFEIPALESFNTHQSHMSKRCTHVQSLYIDLPLRHIDYESSHSPIPGLRGKILAVREMFERRSLSSNCLIENSHFEVSLSDNSILSLNYVYIWSRISDKSRARADQPGVYRCHLSSPEYIHRQDQVHWSRAWLTSPSRRFWSLDRVWTVTAQPLGSILES